MSYGAILLSARAHPAYSCLLECFHLFRRDKGGCLRVRLCGDWHGDWLCVTGPNLPRIPIEELGSS